MSSKLKRPIHEPGLGGSPQALRKLDCMLQFRFFLTLGGAYLWDRTAICPNRRTFYLPYPGFWNLVEIAAPRRSGLEDAISRFSGINASAVRRAVVALAVFSPLVLMLGMGQRPPWETWICRVRSDQLPADKVEKEKLLRTKPTVLMDDDPMRIFKAIRIFRKCLGIVHQNTELAIDVKLVCLAMEALSPVNM